MIFFYKGGLIIKTKVLSIMTSFTVIATTFISLIPVSAVTSNEFFIFDWIGSGEFTATLNPNADFSNITEIEVPATYNDETNQGTVIFTKANIENSTITTISIPSSRTGNSSGGFAGLNALKTIHYTNTSSFEFKAISFEGCSTLREIYIYAPSVTFSGKSGKNAFRTFIGYEDSKIYVTSEDVKNQIISGTSSGTAPVSEDKIIIMTSEKPKSEFTISCDNITYKTEGGLKPQANIIAGDGEITYKLYTDEACLNEYTHSYDSNLLPIGTYYLKGFMAATDNYQNSSSKPIKVQVLPNTNVDKSTLNSIYEEANSFFEENQYYKEDYDTTAWNNVYARGGTLSKAEEIIKDTEGRFTQNEIDEAKDKLLKSFGDLKESPANTEEALKELQNVIEQAEEIIAEVDNGEEVYTEKSYESLLKNLQNAKDLDKATSTKRIINNRIYALQYAIEHLEVYPGEIIPAGEPFAYVQKGGKEVKVVSLIADESMNGSARIKVTFNCANDVSFNEYTSIEVKEVAAKMQSYQKFIGNSWTQGGTNEIDLPLVQEIKTGDQVDISAFTYSWDDAKDYVYGITKVEFYDEKGHILKTIIDKDIEKENLAEAIAEAEKIEKGNYSDESVAELTKAIETAKALTDEATASELKSAITAIENAISGLKLKVVTGTVTGTIKVSDANSETEMTVKAVSYDGTETTVTATSMGTYTLENLEAGSYTLTISGGKYAERSYEITVTEGENTQDVELNPYGDINGDGKITTADVGMANSHAKGVITLTDYGFACADVKTDGSISTADVGMINSHAKSVKTLW